MAVRVAQGQAAAAAAAPQAASEAGQLEQQQQQQQQQQQPALQRLELPAFSTLHAAGRGAALHVALLVGQQGCPALQVLLLLPEEQAGHIVAG